MKITRREAIAGLAALPALATGVNATYGSPELDEAPVGIVPHHLALRAIDGDLLMIVYDSNNAELGRGRFDTLTFAPVSIEGLPLVDDER